MKAFAEKYADQIHGTLSCFDRVLSCGYLPLMSGWQMAEFLHDLDHTFASVKESCLRTRRTRNRRTLHLYGFEPLSP